MVCKDIKKVSMSKAEINVSVGTIRSKVSIKTPSPELDLECSLAVRP